MPILAAERQGRRLIQVCWGEHRSEEVLLGRARFCPLPVLLIDRSRSTAPEQDLRSICGLGHPVGPGFAVATSVWNKDMDESAGPTKLNLKISPVDRLGRSISPVVLAAADQIVLRAKEHAEQLLVDPAIAATLLEEAAAAVSRVLQSRRSAYADRIRDLPSYLFRAFIRRVNRVKRQQLIEQARVASHLKAAPRSINPKPDFEVTILIDELLAKCDSKTRDMFYRRTQGFSWKEIGASYGISGHAAESSFGQAVRRLAKRLRSALSDKRSETD